MKVLAIGGGSIAQRHIRNLNGLGYTDIALVEPVSERRGFIEKNLEIKTSFAALDDALVAGDYDVALVMTPPVSHMEIARECAHRGMHLFIEKPLSNSMEGVEELLGIVADRELLSFVAYNQRFNEGLLKLKEIIGRDEFGEPACIFAWFGQHLPSWRPWQDYRESYTARKELGGGILLDASHELDYCIWLMDRPPIKCFIHSRKLSNLDIDVEDTALVGMEFDNKTMAYIQMNMIEKGYSRGVKVVSRNGNLAKFDFGTSTLEVNLGDREETLGLDFEMAETYMRELKYFINCLERGTRAFPDVAEAKGLMSIIMEAQRL